MDGDSAWQLIQTVGNWIAIVIGMRLFVTPKIDRLQAAHDACHYCNKVHKVA